jgi:2'-5' RNA ligase
LSADAASAAPRSERLFFALWPDASTRASLAHWSQMVHAASGGRPTARENLHLTLAFLGSVAVGEIAPVERAAARVAIERFVLTLDEPGYWKRNRIAWAGARVVPAALERIVAALWAALTEAHVRFDAKPFVPHVTLVRDAPPGFVMPELPPIEWSVHGFALVRSERVGAGVRYVVAKRWRG